MVLPNTTPLGASTLVRKWKLDLDTNADAANPNWVRVMGLGEFKPNPHTATMQDDSDSDSNGYKSSTATALEWGGEGKALRKTQSGDVAVYDVGQEALRLASAGMGLDNRVHVRFYEDNGPSGPKVEAYEGWAAVDWTPDGGGMDALDTVSFKLMGQGKLDAIAHPAAGANPAPTVTGLAPSSAAVAGGTLVMVTGTGFSTVTDVKVDGVSVPVADWEIASATKIALKAPAHVASAGGVDVTVTSPSGTSATSAASKLIYA